MSAATTLPPAPAASCVVRLRTLATRWKEGASLSGQLLSRVFGLAFEVDDVVCAAILISHWLTQWACTGLWRPGLALDQQALPVRGRRQR